MLIGASKPEQILENLRMTEHLDFTREELDAIQQVAAEWSCQLEAIRLALSS